MNRLGSMSLLYRWIMRSLYIRRSYCLPCCFRRITFDSVRFKIGEERHHYIQCYAILRYVLISLQDFYYYFDTWYHSFSIVGMAIGSFLFGSLADICGRKGIISFTMVLIFCSSITLSFAQTVFLINLFIFLLGLG